LHRLFSALLVRLTSYSTLIGVARPVLRRRIIICQGWGSLRVRVALRYFLPFSFKTSMCLESGRLRLTRQTCSRDTSEPSTGSAQRQRRAPALPARCTCVPVIAVLYSLPRRSRPSSLVGRLRFTRHVWGVLASGIPAPPG
jgi:hypothetical protein